MHILYTCKRVQNALHNLYEGCRRTCPQQSGPHPVRHLAVLQCWSCCSGKTWCYEVLHMLSEILSQEIIFPSVGPAAGEEEVRLLMHYKHFSCLDSRKA